MSYRPICDTWLPARSKPAGFLGQARDLLGVGLDDPVLHVCGGRVKDYPYRGYGPQDATVDLDPTLSPTYVANVNDPHFWERIAGDYHAMLIDRPYTEDDADHYTPGRGAFPEINWLLRQSLAAVRPGGRVGVLDYIIPRPPRTARFVACVGVVVGFGNRGRFYTVFEERS